MSTPDGTPKKCIAKTPQQQSLCTCQNAVELVERQQKIWEAHLAQVADQTISYNRWKSAHEDWEQERGDYSNLKNKYNELKNEVKLTNNCFDGGWGNCNYGNKNDWCSNDFGPDWALITGCEQSDCGAYRRGKCQRTDNGLNKAYNEFKNSREPLVDPQDKSPVPTRWKGLAKPSSDATLKPNGTQIVCCSQLFDGINVEGGDVNLADVNQQCSLNISKGLQQEETAEQQYEAEKEKATAPPKSKKKKKGDFELSTEMIIGIVVAAILLFCICGFFLFRKKK